MQVNNISNQTNFKALILPNNADLVKYAGEDVAKKVEKLKPTLEKFSKNAEISIMVKARPNNTTEFIVTVYKKLIQDFARFLKVTIINNEDKEGEIRKNQKSIFYKRMDIYFENNLAQRKRLNFLISNADISKRLVDNVVYTKQTFIKERNANDEFVRNKLNLK